MHSTAWLFNQLGATEVIIIVGAIVLLFGAKKIPELARGLGRGISEFKDGMREGDRPKPPAVPADSVGRANEEQKPKP